MHGCRCQRPGQRSGGLEGGGPRRSTPEVRAAGYLGAFSGCKVTAAPYSIRSPHRSIQNREGVASPFPSSVRKLPGVLPCLSRLPWVSLVRTVSQQDEGQHPRGWGGAHAAWSSRHRGKTGPLLAGRGGDTCGADNQQSLLDEVGRAPSAV